jgi:uncharacterized membrane protein
MYEIITRGPRCPKRACKKLVSRQLAFCYFIYRFTNGAWQLAQLLLLKNIFVMLWTLLLIIPGVIKGYAYSQAIYLYKEDIAQNGRPTKRVVDYITTSRQLMHDRKFERFMIDVSFIGWYIVAALTFGIGLLWLLPYVSGTYAAYHLAIRHTTIE